MVTAHAIFIDVSPYLLTFFLNVIIFNDGMSIIVEVKDGWVVVFRLIVD